jgi:multidrug efflux pump
MMVVHLVSPDNRYDAVYLRNYAVLNVKDRLAAIDGVGEVQLLGSGDYAMRVCWTRRRWPNASFRRVTW